MAIVTRRRLRRIAGPGLLLGLLTACQPSPPPPLVPPPPPPKVELAQPAAASAYAGEYTPSTVGARIPSYTLRQDLSDVANLKQFPQLTAAQKRQLGTLGFVAWLTPERRIDEPYLAASKQQLPVFVTADAAMVCFQRWSEDAWRRVQAEALPALLSAFTLSMLQRSQEQVETAPAGELHDAAVRNAAYFGVPAGLLGIDIQIAPAAAELIAIERQRIADASAIAECGPAPLSIDYTVFAAPAGEAPPARLWAVRQALQWYRSAAFPLRDAAGQPNRAAVRQVLLWSHAAAQEPAAPLAKWAALEQTLAWFEGRGPGVDPATVLRAAAEIYGPHRTIDSYRAFDQLATFAEAVAQTGPVRVLPAAALPDDPLLAEFRLAVERPLCSGVQLMAGFGLPRAVQLVDQVFRLPAHDPAYAALLTRMGELAAQTSEESMRGDLPWGRFWAIAPLSEPAPAGRPKFCASNAWYDRCLSSTLATWVSWRHQPWLAMPGEPEQPGTAEAAAKPPVGYVEPAPEVFRRLGYLVETTARGLSQHGLLNGAIELSQQRLRELLAFLEQVAGKELGNESLVDTERQRLATIGHELGWFASGLDASLWATAERLPRVSYLPAAEELALECGVGPVMRIVAVVPDGGTFHLALGALASYVERLPEGGARLDDAGWEALFEGGAQPPLPAWCDSFVLPVSAGVPQPVGPVLFEAPDGN